MFFYEAFNRKNYICSTFDYPFDQKSLSLFNVSNSSFVRAGLKLKEILKFSLQNLKILNNTDVLFA